MVEYDWAVSGHARDLAHEEGEVAAKEVGQRLLSGMRVVARDVFGGEGR